MFITTITKTCAEWVSKATYDGAHIEFLMNPFFPKQCGHTEGVLTVRVKAGCSVEMVSYVRGICDDPFSTKVSPASVFDGSLARNGGPRHFSCKFPSKMCGPSLGHSIFCKISHQMALVTCPCAF